MWAAWALATFNVSRLSPHSPNAPHSPPLPSRQAFQDADWDGGGELSTEELFAWFGEPVTPFSKTIFRLADMDDSGMLDFPEFVKVNLRQRALVR